MTENPANVKNNGYAICFNEWLFDNRIKNELNLLLFISSLTAENGYCYASNKYFAEIFNIDEVSVSRKIKKLEKLGHIRIEYEKRGCEVKKRFIRLTKMLIDDLQKNQSTINKNVKENNTSINNTSVNNIYRQKRKKIVPLDWKPTDETAKKLRNRGIDAELATEKFIDSCQANGYKYLDFNRAILAWNWERDKSVAFVDNRKASDILKEMGIL